MPAQRGLPESVGGALAPLEGAPESLGRGVAESDSVGAVDSLELAGRLLENALDSHASCSGVNGAGGSDIV